MLTCVGYKSLMNIQELDAFFAGSNHEQNRGLSIRPEFSAVWAYNPLTGTQAIHRPAKWNCSRKSEERIIKVRQNDVQYLLI